MMSVSFRSDIDKLERKLDVFARKQIPFAVATGLTDLAREVAESQQDALEQVFDRPTPFTVNALGVKPARKDDWEAQVFVKDKTAEYLEPYEFGGDNKLNGKALIEPVDEPLNQYGNLPRRKLEQLKARPDVFIGKVKTSIGEIDGVWQRPYIRGNQKIRGKSRKLGWMARGANTTGHLKLLIRFADAHPAKQQWGYRARAVRVATARFDPVIGKALSRAIASAK